MCQRRPSHLLPPSSASSLTECSSIFPSPEQSNTRTPTISTDICAEFQPQHKQKDLMAIVSKSDSSDPFLQTVHKLFLKEKKAIWKANSHRSEHEKQRLWTQRRSELVTYGDLQDEPVDRRDQFAPPVEDVGMNKRRRLVQTQPLITSSSHPPRRLDLIDQSAMSMSHYVPHTNGYNFNTQLTPSAYASHAWPGLSPTDYQSQHWCIEDHHDPVPATGLPNRRLPTTSLNVSTQTDSQLALEKLSGAGSPPGFRDAETSRLRVTLNGCPLPRQGARSLSANLKTSTDELTSTRHYSSVEMSRQTTNSSISRTSFESSNASEHLVLDQGVTRELCHAQSIRAGSSLNSEEPIPFASFALSPCSQSDKLRCDAQLVPVSQEMAQEFSFLSTSDNAMPRLQHVERNTHASRPLAPKVASDDTALWEQRSMPTTVKSEDGSTKQVVAISKTPYVRPTYPKKMCRHCNEHPDGFRGEHELRRHTERAHSNLRKMWMCITPPERPNFLGNCKACMKGKKYGADYNAAAHLRRAHFNPRKRRNSRNKNDEKRGGKAGGKNPSMDELRAYMKEVDVRTECDVQDDMDDTLSSAGSNDINAPSPIIGGNLDSHYSLHCSDYFDCPPLSAAPQTYLPSIPDTTQLVTQIGAWHDTPYDLSNSFDIGPVFPDPFTISASQLNTCSPDLYLQPPFVHTSQTTVPTEDDMFFST